MELVMEPIDTPEQDELTVLKARADMMGIAYHPSIGVDKLRAKIQEKLDGKEEEVEEEVKETVKEAKKETLSEQHARLQKESSRLVRINVTCMNPMKKEWEGEIITAGNAVVGTHRKYVPFNTSEGWHVPYIIFKQLQERKFQSFYTVKDNRGNDLRRSKLIPEFSIQELTPLTKEEIQELARKQSMSKSIA